MYLALPLYWNQSIHAGTWDPKWREKTKSSAAIYMYMYLLYQWRTYKVYECMIQFFISFEFMPYPSNFTYTDHKIVWDNPQPLEGCHKTISGWITELFRFDIHLILSLNCCMTTPVLKGFNVASCTIHNIKYFNLIWNLISHIMFLGTHCYKQEQSSH